MLNWVGDPCLFDPLFFWRILGTRDTDRVPWKFTGNDGQILCRGMNLRSPRTGHYVVIRESK